LSIDTPSSIAEMLQVKWDLGLNGSVLIANPVPKDQEVDSETIEGYIQQALSSTTENNIIGKEITPFLLKYIAEHSKGESLDANIALIHHNARLAGKIAVEMKG
jgi:pseudouridine-5'-phosphate glycosidase